MKLMPSKQFGCRRRSVLADNDAIDFQAFGGNERVDVYLEQIDIQQADRLGSPLSLIRQGVEFRDAPDARKASSIGAGHGFPG